MSIMRGKKSKSDQSQICIFCILFFFFVFSFFSEERGLGVIVFHLVFPFVSSHFSLFLFVVQTFLSLSFTMAFGCISFSILQIIVLALSVLMTLQGVYNFITFYVVAIYSWLIFPWAMTLGSISCFTGLIGIANALSAMFRKPGIYRWLCLVHCLFVFFSLGCICGAYIHSGLYWGSNCTDACIIRLTISGFFFFAFTTVYLVFSTLFLLRAKSGDEDSLLRK